MSRGLEKEVKLPSWRGSESRCDTANTSFARDMCRVSCESRGGSNQFVKRYTEDC